MDDQLLAAWLAEERRSFTGWDFSRFQGKLSHQPPPWNYRAIARELLVKATAVLDMGTGGGEILSSLGPLPAGTVATEGWEPNVAVAKKRLAPLGVKVVLVPNHQPLPFPDGSFDLVFNRHSWFDANEIARVLKSGGTLCLQQVDGRNLSDLKEFFGRENRMSDRVPEVVRKEMLSAGLTIRKEQSWFGKMVIADVTALVHFLHAIPWIVVDFSVEKDLPILRKIQDAIDRNEPPIFREGRYLFVAEKVHNVVRDRRLSVY